MKILFLGDFFYDYDNIQKDIDNISNYIKKNNLITILNLEGTICSNTSKSQKKGVLLNMSNKYIEVLKKLNVKAVNIANNHIMDYKEEGLKNIINDLKNNNIKYFGAGLNLNDAKKPIVLDLDKKVALMGMGWNMEECINATRKKAGVCPLDFKLLESQVNNTECDIFIPVLHFGYEYENLPQPYHLKECRKIKSNDKVKLIIGHHPHVVQAYEDHIFYSLGNFYFGTTRNDFYNGNIKETNKGIGVIFDTTTFNTKTIEFRFDGKYSVVKEEVSSANFIDLSNIETQNYTEYFYTYNKFKNKKYVYKIGFLNEKIFNNLKYYKRDLYKKYLRNIKWPLIKKIKKMVRR